MPEEGQETCNEDYREEYFKIFGYYPENTP